MVGGTYRSAMEMRPPSGRRSIRVVSTSSSSVSRNSKRPARKSSSWDFGGGGLVLVSASPWAAAPARPASSQERALLTATTERWIRQSRNATCRWSQQSGWTSSCSRGWRAASWLIDNRSGGCDNALGGLDWPSLLWSWGIAMVGGIYPAGRDFLVCPRLSEEGEESLGAARSSEAFQKLEVSRRTRAHVRSIPGSETTEVGQYTRHRVQK